MYIIGIVIEVRSQGLNEKKLDSKTINIYFVRYFEQSLFEMENAQSFENIEFKEGDKVKNFVFEKEFVSIPLVIIDHD